MSDIPVLSRRVFTQFLVERSLLKESLFNKLKFNDKKVSNRVMSEDNQDESLPSEVSMGVVMMSLENNQESSQKDDINGGNTNMKNDKQKIDILLKATGNAPIMKKKKWAVDAEKPIGWIMEFVKKYLKLDANEKLFLYVNQTFAPSPDQIVRNLYECFGTDGKLILHYCKSQAWG